MTALNGPVRRWRGLLLDVGEVALDGVAGREVDEEESRFVIPPSRSVAWLEPCTCEPAMSLYERSIIEAGRLTASQLHIRSREMM